MDREEKVEAGLGCTCDYEGSCGAGAKGKGDEATALVWGPPLAIVSLERNYPSIGY